MKSLLPLTLALALSPLAAFALPVVGDVVGTTPEAATAALEAAGCTVDKFEAENGQIEASCTETATGKAWDIAIDPTSGAVTEVKGND